MSAMLEEILREIERLRREVDALRCLDQPTLTGHTHTQAQSHNSPDTDAAPTSLHHTLGAGGNQASAGNHGHAGVYSPVGHAHTQAESHYSADTDSSAAALHHTLGGGANQSAAGNHGHAGVYSPVGHAHTQAESHYGADTDGSAAALHHTLGGGANQAAAGNHTHSAQAGVYYPLANPTNVWNNVNVSDGTWDYAATSYGVPSGATAIVVRARCSSSGAWLKIRKRYSAFDDMMLQGTAGANPECDQGIVRLNADVFTIAVTSGWVYGFVDIVGYFK